MEEDEGQQLLDAARAQDPERDWVVMPGWVAETQRAKAAQDAAVARIKAKQTVEEQAFAQLREIARRLRIQQRTEASLPLTAMSQWADGIDAAADVLSEKLRAIHEACDDDDGEDDDDFVPPGTARELARQLRAAADTLEESLEEGKE